MKPSITVKAASGKVYHLTDPSTKRLVPKLREAGVIRASSAMKGMKGKIMEARAKGVPLHKVLRVS